MALLLIVVILGLSCSVFSQECKTAKPVDNFSMERFSGVWHESAMDPLHPNDINKHGNSRCGFLIFNLKNNTDEENTWLVDSFLSDTSKNDLGGSFYVPDPSKGLLKLFNTVGNFTFDFTITCTDYDYYFVAYACGKARDFTSEFVLIFTRHDDQYNDIVNNKVEQVCFDGFMEKPAIDIKRRPAC